MQEVIGHLQLKFCRYAFYDVYTEAYVADFKNWDVAIVTLQEPVGLHAGWMGIKALPPAGACSADGVLLPSLHTVGYPVEDNVSDHAYADVCDLYVCAHQRFCVGTATQLADRAWCRCAYRAT